MSYANSGCMIHTLKSSQTSIGKIRRGKKYLGSLGWFDWDRVLSELAEHRIDGLEGELAEASQKK